MTGAATRVAFAGLAHSHPYSDAGNLLAFGAEVVGVVDADAPAAAEFAARFGGVAVSSAAEFRGLGADLVIATPRPDERVPLLRALTTSGATAPVFFNKVVAATAAQFEEWDEAIDAASVPVGTSSVLRFAPAIEQLARALSTEEILSIRVLAQHDNTAFQLPGREWQDDPARGGGTLVTVGVHAWELIDRMFPGAVFDGGAGWTRRRIGSTTRSEDAGGIDGWLRLTGADHSVPVQVLVTGVSGPDAYSVEVVTARGIRSADLDVTDANDALGFAGLIRTLLVASAAGQVAAPWAQARAVVRNTIRAAELARAGSGRTSWNVHHHP
jgi:predicted dehydrogenase